MLWKSGARAKRNQELPTIPASDLDDLKKPTSSTAATESCSASTICTSITTPANESVIILVTTRNGERRAVRGESHEGRTITTGGAKNGLGPSKDQLRMKSILIVPTQEESVSEEAYESCLSESRTRRREIIRKRRQSTCVNGIECPLECPDSVYSPGSTMPKPVNSDGPLVRFSKVTMRKFPIILGDNPGGRTGGPPISIDWDHFATAKFNLEDFENHKETRKKKLALMKPPKKQHPKSPSEQHYISECDSDCTDYENNGLLAVSPEKRLLVLSRIGYSLDEIVDRRMEMNLIRAQRRKSYKDSLVQGRDFRRELQESVADTAINVLTFGAKARIERKLLKPFCNKKSKKNKKNDNKGKKRRRWGRKGSATSNDASTENDSSERSNDDQKELEEEGQEEETEEEEVTVTIQHAYTSPSQDEDDEVDDVYGGSKKFGFVVEIDQVNTF